MVEKTYEVEITGSTGTSHQLTKDIQDALEEVL